MAAQLEIPRPTPTGNKGERQGASFDIYLDAQGDPPRWSGKISLPEDGDRIRITMNNIGPALVVGYFAEEGFLGVSAATNERATLQPYCRRHGH